MKFKLTSKALIVGAVLLLTGAAVAFANGGYWGEYGGRMMGPGYGNGRMGYGAYGMGPGMMGYGGGYGMGPGMMGYGAYGMGPGMMGYGPGYGSYGNGNGYAANLTQEQRDKLDATQEKFYSETQKLREKIQDQQYALRSELAKDNPDADKVGTLQKGLSKLEGEFDQKAVQYQLEVRKILPDSVARGFARGYGGGYCWR